MCDELGLRGKHASVSAERDGKPSGTRVLISVHVPSCPEKYEANRFHQTDVHIQTITSTLNGETRNREPRTQAHGRELSSRSINNPSGIHGGTEHGTPLVPRNAAGQRARGQQTRLPIGESASVLRPPDEELPEKTLLLISPPYKPRAKLEAAA